MKSQIGKWLLPVTVIVLTALTVGSVLRLSDAKAGALDARENLARVAALANRIEALRKSQNRALVQGEQKIESSKNWIQYAQAVQITERQITKIERLPLKKVGNTEYSRDDVFMQISSVSPTQLVAFLLKCEDAQVGYQATSVHLSRGTKPAGDKEVWNADLLLTRILYTATNPTPGR